MNYTKLYWFTTGKMKTGTKKGRIALIEKTAVIGNPTGMHARPASKLLAVIKKYKCSLTLAANGRKTNPRSILNLLSMGLKQGSEVTVRADGENEGEAAAEIAEYLENFRDSGGPDE